MKLCKCSALLRLGRTNMGDGIRRAPVHAAASCSHASYEPPACFLCITEKQKYTCNVLAMCPTSCLQA